MLDRFDCTVLGAVGSIFVGMAVVFGREERWKRRRRIQLGSSRPPLGDAEFLRAVAAHPSDELRWLAVRRVMADAAGLPGEAVRPGDHLADLWRLQSLGPDLMDIAFRLELVLRVKVDRHLVARSAGPLRYGQAGEFAGFARAIVGALGGRGAA